MRATRAPRLLVLIASVRQGRVGSAVGDWVVDAAHRTAAHQTAADRTSADRSAGLDVQVIDLAELALPLCDEPNHPKLGAYLGEPALGWSAIVGAADAFVFVMPEYNHSFSAPLKNAIDYLFAEWASKPIGLVSYGGLSGGTRAVTALQPVLLNLGMSPVRTNVEIAWVDEHIRDGVFEANERQERALAAQLDELQAALG